MSVINNKTINAAVWYTISNIIAKAMTVLLTPILSRLLSTNDYGIYTNFIAWQNMFVILFSLELSSTVLRAKFDYDEQKFADYVYSVSLFSVIFPFAVVGLLLLFLGSYICALLDLSKNIVICLYLIVIFYSMLQIFQAEQRASAKYKISSVITICFSILQIGMPLFLCLWMNDKLIAVIIAITIDYILFGTLIFVHYFRKVSKKGIQKEYIKYAMIIALPVVPHLISNMIMGNIDKVMITKICGLNEAAFYGVAYTSALVVTLLRNSLNNAWVPWLYGQLKISNYNRIKKVSNLYAVMFSFFTVEICFWGPEIIMVLGGEAYMEAVALIPIIMLGCYYNFMYLFYVNLEFYKKKTIMISVITIVAASLNVGLNYIGINFYGYQTAAITTAICNGLIVLLHYLVTKKMNNRRICDNRIILIFCTVAIPITFLFIKIYQVNTIVRISLALFMTFGMGILLFIKRRVLVKIGEGNRDVSKKDI